MKPGYAVAALLGLAACQRPSVPAPHPHYRVGAAYQAGGIWRYPRERFEYDRTGVASVARRGAGLTADGERYDPRAMAAASPTLQLPAIVRVTDLDTGRSAVLRVNDRGPVDPGRLIALTPRAGSALDIPAGGTARVRVVVEAAPSEALRDALGGGPGAAMAAPIGAVRAESLAPPPGASHPVRLMGEPGAGQASAPALPPDRLPARITQGPPRPGPLWLDLGNFHGATYADERRAQLGAIGARVEREGRGHGIEYRVRAGPYPTVTAADMALDQALRAGVIDARITAQ